MTCSIFIYGLSLDIDKGKLDREFRLVHEGEHGIDWGCHKEHGFVNISCHWDWDHGVKTMEHMRQVLNDNSLEDVKMVMHHGSGTLEENEGGRIYI